ncbi:hypothetical protein N7474_001971 [Penicillium riverlandense]|uniref:uncharacterized protein n=1 Tax=Penicillium riverlandense TaxID=1903569 RepID=UPI0025470E9B|nr:uncharacterized protein N7474_001971 [Penicillium riverlandense]KAJ5833660.1 hypothetical protein N7474_001971 [Penicillium riverlandense]
MDFEAKKDDAQHIELSSASGQPNEDLPMNWSWLRKHIILMQCGLHALGPGFTCAILIPSTGQIATQFGVTPQTATYLVAVQVLFLGLGPFLWIPLMNSYGRRPALIGSMLLSSIAALGGGFAKTYGTLMTARVFQIIGISSGLVVPGVIVVDLFRPEERGSKNGIWTQMVAIGPPLGGLIGGPVAEYVGWQWAMWIVAIANFVEALAYVLSCPETSYEHRRYNGMGAYHPAEYLITPKPLPEQLKLRSFIEPVLFLQSPHVTLIAFAYGVTFAITSPGLSAIVPLALKAVYNFDAVQQGLFFIGPLLGVVFGELLAGTGSDWAMNRERRLAVSTNRPARLESRLWVGIPGHVLSVVGILIFGITLQNRTHWIGPCLGYAISNFGLQLVTTPLKTYCVDCYTAHSGSVLQFMNVVRQVISFTVPFWSPNLNENLGYDLGFGIEAIILVIFYLASLLIFWKGAVWRQSVEMGMLVSGDGVIQDS